MKRLKYEPLTGRRFKLSHCLFVVAALYLLIISFKFQLFLQIATMLTEEDTEFGSDVMLDDAEGEEVNRAAGSVDDDTLAGNVVGNVNENAPSLTQKENAEGGNFGSLKTLPNRYGRITGEIMRRRNRTLDLSILEQMADEAWILGSKAWEDLANLNLNDTDQSSSVVERKPESCPSWVSMTKEELATEDSIMFLPCGLAAGSSITVVGTPHYAHPEYVPQRGKSKTIKEMVMVSQFMIELQGLKAVVGEDPPKIFHLNPRLKGDWSRRPVIEHNTCYRMQWGTAQRCDGASSRKDDDMLVDGYKKCEKWMRNAGPDSKESKTSSWLKRFIGREQKPDVVWPFPFIEGKLFILTLRAGLEGYHVSVGGRHLSSFPYRPGFTLEDSTGLAIKGDLDVHSVYATSLPTSHRSFSPQRVLDMSEKWKVPPLSKSSIRLFIGILSATNHFSERMAIRKTWMQSSAVKSSTAVVRFFVALNPRSEVNAVLKKEASYFGDIVILPFMDRYELVVLKTVAICEYGVQNVTAAYIMKCDDDTFARVDTVLKEIDGISLNKSKSLYMGNLNLLHRPLRSGKWAVSFEEWPEFVYPPYANGPGYIISSDIAKYIASQHANGTLRLFKMEDVSMGLWVEQFNNTRPVQYSHSWKFCQYGCMEDYYTAHYQSPRQMICLWDKLARGRAQCCNFR
ncbi:hypothetical protein QQ045_007742 [Rhodiola kirilowii]